MTDSYTIGIYGLIDSKFSLVLVDSDHNLIKVEY
jgi:hypothetical protein